jgi:hypothetical protein
LGNLSLFEGVTAQRIVHNLQRNAGEKHGIDIGNKNGR